MNFFSDFQDHEAKSLGTPAVKQACFTKIEENRFENSKIVTNLMINRFVLNTRKKIADSK